MADSSDSAFKPMKAESINVSKLTLSNMKKLDNGAHTMFVNYSENGDDSQPLYIQSPEVDLPFDGKYWPDNDKSGKWAIKANLKGEKCAEFVKKLQEMDGHIKNLALDNSMAWFKKRNLSAESIDALYTPMIRESTDPETGELDGRWPPSFTFKIVKRDSTVRCKFWKGKGDEYNITDQDSEEYTPVDDLVKKGTKARILLRCNGVWIANGKFGCTWRAEQMRVKPVVTFDAYAFDEDDEDEEVQRIDENLIESSDEEEEAEPPAEAVKKVRKVKKVPK